MEHEWEFIDYCYRCKNCGIFGIWLYSGIEPFWYNDMWLTCEEIIIREIIE